MKLKLENYKAIIKAYCDCNDSAEHDERNLNFFSKDHVDGKTLIELMPVVVPNGYNDFDAVKSIGQLVKTFGNDAQYFVSRENSVCIYIRPINSNVWLDGTNRLNNIQADEVMFCPKLQMFRVWWD